MRLNRSGNRPSLAAARGISALIMIQPLSAPKPEMMTAIAITLPAQVPPNIALTASEYGALPEASLELGTIPKTAVSHSMYTTATASVPSTVARGMLRSGLRTFPRGDRGGLHADVAEQRDGHPAADSGDRALLADVPRREVGGLDIEQADDRNER